MLSKKEIAMLKWVFHCFN